MQFETLFKAAREKPVRCALIGAGEFGLSLIAQSRRMQGLEVVAVVDRDANRVAAALAEMAVPAGIASTAETARQRLTAGEVALCTSVETLLSLGLEHVVEATGDPEHGARHAVQAIEAGIGVTMVSKEAECVVGPLLALKARQKGVAYSLVEGDQPALLIGLLSWARTLGLPVIAAGKSSEYDYVLDREAGTVTWQGRSVTTPTIEDLWSLGKDTAATLNSRAALVAELPRRTVPDYCEMALVANATGLVPDRPDFHAPYTRSAELADVYIPRDAGGVLDRTGILDVFNCLRRSDEASFAGGVFAIVEWPDDKTAELFRGKGIPTSRQGRYGLVYNPSHLLGVEAPISIMAAARLDHCLTGESYRPVVDLTAKATRDLEPGRQLDIVGTRHEVPDLTPLLTPAKPASGNNPLPYYMLVGCTLRRPVSAGAFITAEDVAAPEGAVLWQLRCEQDQHFFR